MRKLLALVLPLLLVALTAACDTTEPETCTVPSTVEAGRLAACVSGDVDLELDATVSAFTTDEGEVVIEFREGRSGGTLVLSTAADPDLFPVAVKGPDGATSVAFFLVTVDEPGTFDTFNGLTGTVTVDSVGADGALAGTLDIAAGSRTGELRVEGRFRTGPLPT
ncbi:hypothetical protein [Rubrivirga sp. IMCC43871]|uniref:hypothetical protein n=1 Tax=Rubrivirga sp. IMCC43871 TaxID=3391575 RepID=UPI00398FE540